MNWILIALLAYFIFAVVAIIDKFLLTKAIPSPISYAFYVGLLSFFVVFFIPFGFSLLPLPLVLLALLTGAVFLGALIFFYQGVYKEEVSRVVMIIGGLTPIFIFLLSFVFLGERLAQREILAFLVLILGTILITFKKGVRYKAKGLFSILLAAFLFALHAVMIKYIFLQEDFLNVFIWTRWGSFLAAFLLLIPANNRRLIFKSGKKVKTKNSFLLVGGKALSGVGFVFVNYAIFQESVTLVNAIEGSRFAFVFLITLAISLVAPHVLKEEIKTSVLIRKIIAVFLIGLGLAILAF